MIVENGLEKKNRLSFLSNVMHSNWLPSKNQIGESRIGFKAEFFRYARGNK